MPCTKAREIDLAEFAVDSRAPAWAEFRDHYPGCPECSHAVARLSALEAALRTEGGGSSAHASEAQLVALASSSFQLAREDLARVEAHLAGCAPCRTELAAVRSFDFSAVAAAPERVGALGGLGATLAAALRRPAFVAAVVGAMIAIPAAMLLWRPLDETAPAPSPPVAEVEPSAPPVAVEEAPPPAPPEPEPEPTIPTPQEPTAPAARPESSAVAKQRIEPPEPSQPSRPIEIAALVPAESPLYAPGALANAPIVRVGDAARSAGTDVPPPVALGPAHVGASTRESPSLYWFLPEATPLSVEVTLIEPSVSEPALEVMLPGPHAAGVHRMSLAERGVRLRPGVDYQWFVALVRNPERRSQDAVSGAAIRYAPPSGEIAARLSAAAPGRAAHLHAESGFWYDAFDQLSSWLAAEPGAARLREHRAALLEQVGLGDAAAFGRSRSRRAD